MLRPLRAGWGEPSPINLSPSLGRQGGGQAELGGAWRGRGRSGGEGNKAGGAFFGAIPLLFNEAWSSTGSKWLQLQSLLYLHPPSSISRHPRLFKSLIPEPCSNRDKVKVQVLSLIPYLYSQLQIQLNSSYKFIQESGECLRRAWDWRTTLKAKINIDLTHA